MRKSILIILFVYLCCTACNKDSFTNNANAYLYAQLPLNVDTLSFGTVFTSVGSVTQSFMLKNADNKSIHISDINLSGGNKSCFKINVNGNAGTDFQNIDLAAGDSIYIFVMVNINPTDDVDPFIIADSIGYSWNGNTRYVQLRAAGQNALFLQSQTTQHDTTWTNKLPIVISGSFTVGNNTTLAIQKGTKVYLHAKTIFQVNGRLIASGGPDTTDRILFTGDRLDDPYNESPNQWRGINIGASSTGNTLQNVTIKNADIGITDTLGASIPSTPKLSLSNCILTTHNFAALYFRNSNVEITNSLIANSNAQVIMENGGSYSFNYCTIAGYSNDYIQHANPSVVIQNNSQSLINPLHADFTNSIIYGDQSQNDEISTGEDGASNFSVVLDYCIYKLNSSVDGVSFSNSFQNTDPMFLATDNFHNIFDFHVQENSPAIGSAHPNAVTTDISGQSRDVTNPTIGCYEFKD